MNHRLATFAPGFILLLLLAACKDDSSAPAPAPQPVAVRTASVGGGGEDWIEVPGTVEASRSASLASRISAVVESVAVEEGAVVQAGDLLVRLDGRDLRARVDAAQASLKTARAQRERIRALVLKGAATPQELEAAEAADSGAAAESDAARAQLQYADLRAPFAGLITGKAVHAGDLAVPGQALLTLQGTGVLRVSASMTREQAEGLALGQRVAAVFDDGSIVDSRVAVLGPAGDPGSRRFLIKTDLPEASPARAGTFVRLRLPRGAEEPEPLVPAAAIFRRGALTGVYVVEEGLARLRWFSAGETLGGAVVARAGVKSGEVVILHPPALRDGTPVRVDAVAPATGVLPESPAGPVPASSKEPVR